MQILLRQLANVVTTDLWRIKQVLLHQQKKFS